MNYKVNYKLINITLFLTIIYLLFKTKGLWFAIINNIFKILKPFIISFIIAYCLYPFLNILRKKKISKILSVIIIITLVLLILFLIFFFFFKYSYKELYILFNSGINILSKIDKDIINNYFNNILNISKSLITNLFIIIGSCIYILIDMDKIRNNIKKLIKNNKTYLYVKTLDQEMKKYLNGLVQIMFITLIEYSLAYLIIGHPSTLLIALLASFSNLIPSFGGIIVNIFALMISISISKSLAIKTLILIIILGIIDGYVINPIIYGKTNNIHPLLIIFFAVLLGTLFGPFGIVLSFPITIFIIVTYKFYFKDVLIF